MIYSKIIYKIMLVCICNHHCFFYILSNLLLPLSFALYFIWIKFQLLYQLIYEKKKRLLRISYVINLFKNSINQPRNSYMCE